MRSIRLQLALVLVEEQHQMMATLAHLFLAFQITIELFKSNLPPEVRLRVAPFIREFRTEFQRNVESFCNLVALVRKQPELQHLAGKLPPEQMKDLPAVIDGLKEQFVLYHLNKQKQRDLTSSTFKLNDVLNINVAVKGLKIPIPFRVDQHFHRDCHGHFDVQLVSQAFRDKLGQLYQTELLRKCSQ